MAKELCTGWFHIVAGTVRKTLILTFHCSPAFLQQENWLSTICLDIDKYVLGFIFSIARYYLAIEYVLCVVFVVSIACSLCSVRVSFQVEDRGF